MVVVDGQRAWREHGKTWLWSAAAALLLAGAVLVVADVLRSLHLMTDQLGTVSQHLSSLDSMDRKLDGLGAMQKRLDTVDAHLGALQTTLDRANAKLDAANRRLDTAIGKLSSTDRTLGDMDRQFKGTSVQMRSVARSLVAMRGDVHTVAHKVDGSFLFRGVR